jgi:hypothetical protein
MMVRFGQCQGPKAVALNEGVLRDHGVPHRVNEQDSKSGSGSSGDTKAMRLRVRELTSSLVIDCDGKERAEAREASPTSLPSQS